MINDSGVFVPHTRSFPGTSNLQYTLGILWQNHEYDREHYRSISGSGYSLVSVCERSMTSIVAAGVSTAFQK